MLNNIFTILEKIGLGTQRRALHIQFSNTELNHKVLLQRIDGNHAISEGLSAELLCLSTNPYISLKQFIGCQVAIDQVTDSGQLFRSSGIITEAVQGQSDGALSIYSLRMQDATALWHQRRNSRVFMNKTAIEIVETIFKEWQTKSPLFAVSLQLDLTGLKNNYDIRPFSMQLNESDYSYISRLLRESGVSWLVDEASYMMVSQLQGIEAQKLRLIDDNAQYSALTRRVIRYHRSNATEKADSITSFIAQRQLQPTAIHVQRWQADALAQEEGAGSVLSSHQHSSQQGNESLSLEQAWHISPAWISDLKGEDQATKSSNAQIEKLNTLSLGAQTVFLASKSKLLVDTMVMEVDGKICIGKFHRIYLKEGDYVVCVAKNIRNNVYELYSVLSPESGLLYMQVGMGGAIKPIKKSTNKTFYMLVQL